MKIGIPKEIKPYEYRVGATPNGIKELVKAGHKVFVQRAAGLAIGFNDDSYKAAGACIVDREKVYEAELIVKVKEPQASEYPLLKKNQLLFCYLHLAAEPNLQKALLEQEVIAIAYETVQTADQRLPLLMPMSEIAGRLSVQVGANLLQSNYGGKGILLGGTVGVKPATVTIVGAGIAGTAAARLALGFGADVTIIDKDLERLKQLDYLFGPALKTRFSTSKNIEDCLIASDLIISAVLIVGEKAPKLITREMVQKIPKDTVIIDIAIDQGGSLETSCPTTHENPTYQVYGVTHYCVTNMPAACSLTATLALTQVTLDYILLLANLGLEKALLNCLSLKKGLNVYLGEVIHPALKK